MKGKISDFLKLFLAFYEKALVVARKLSSRKSENPSFQKQRAGHNLKFIPLALLIGCMPPPGYGPGPGGGYNPNYYPSTGVGGPPGGSATPPRSDAEYDAKKARDSDRAEVLNNSRSRGGDLCEDESKNHDCRAQCKEMYRNGNDREDCEELPTDQVEKLLDVHRALKNPSGDKLENIDLEDLEVYLNVSIAAFDKVVTREYRRSDAEDIFLWLTDDEEVADLLKDEDDDYRTLEGLLKVIQSYSSSSEVEKPFQRELYRDDTLFEMAIEAGNETAAEYFLEYIFEKSSHCRNGQEVSQECWGVICAIGKDFNDSDNRLDFLENFSVFSNYVDDIITGDRNPITGGVNGGNWLPDTRRPTTQNANTRYKTSDDVIANEKKGDWCKALCVGAGGITAEAQCSS